MSKNTIVAVVGKRGYGKSTYLRRTLADVRPLIMVDTLSEHGDWLPVPPLAIEEMIDEIESHMAAEDQIDVMMPYDEGEKVIAFEFIAKAAYAATNRIGQITLAVDEIDWYCSANWQNEGLNLVVQYGRHGPVNLIWTARSLVSVSRRLTSETDVYILFGMSEPAWLDALAERLGEEIAEEVERLEKFQYLTVQDGQFSKANL